MIEVVTSLAISSILLVAIGSAMVLASRALPTADSTATATLTAANAVDKIAAELRFALQITERTSTALRFTIPDRDGDGNAEVIRYTWNGSPGAPLTRQYNSTAAVTLIDGVQSIDLNFEQQSVKESYPGPIVEEAETLLASHAPASYVSGEHYLNPFTGAGQFIKPALPVDAYQWKPTRIVFRAKRNSVLLPLGLVALKIHKAGADKLPAGSALTSGTIAESALSSSMNWVTVNLSGLTGLDPSENLAFLVENAINLGTAARVEYCAGSGGSMLTASSGSYSVNPSNSMRYFMYGQISKATTRTLTRSLVTSARIGLQTASDVRGKIETAVVLPNRPESLTAQWETDFSSNPTTADQNADGQPDWSSATGFDTGRLSSGVWRADRTLTSNPLNAFTDFTTVEVGMRDTTIDGSGAALEMRVEATLLGHGIIEAYVAKQSNGKQTFTLQTRDLLLLPKVLLTVPKLSTEMVNVKLYVNPADDSIGVVIDGLFQGSYNYNRSVDLSDGSIRISSTLLESGAEFDHIKVRVGGAP